MIILILFLDLWIETEYILGTWKDYLHLKLRLKNVAAEI